LFDRHQIGLILDSFAAGRTAELLADLDASIRESVGSLRSSLAGGQPADVSRRAHRLAGAALNFGLPALHRSAQELERSVGREGSTRLGQRLMEIEQAAEAALQAISLLRGNLSDGAVRSAADGRVTANG
jgi:HPt (histidine-containing phosphotransfer) domain-containing protein